MKNILVVSSGNNEYSEKKQEFIKEIYKYFQNKDSIDDFYFLNSFADSLSLLKYIESMTK